MTDLWQACWNRLRVQQKVLIILLMVFPPIIAAIAVHISLVNHLLTLKQQHHQLLLAREQVHVLRRLAVDIEDAFCGFLLTRQRAFLQPMLDAEPQLNPTVDRIVSLVERVPGLQLSVQVVGERLRDLLRSKHDLINQVQSGDTEEVLRYVQSGKGIELSNALLSDLREIEDQLNHMLEAFELNETGLVRYALWGLVLALVGSLILGLLGAGLLTRSITAPLQLLQSSVVGLAKQVEPSSDVKNIGIRSSDEIGQLARAFEEMVRQVRQQIRELEAITAIGQEINMIGPDGVEGVLHRITNRAAELLHVDLCLVMLRSHEMGCWVIEAASGEE